MGAGPREFAISCSSYRRNDDDHDLRCSLLDGSSKEEYVQMNNVLIIQARMSSTRLPGKVLKDIQGAPMLNWVVERCKSAKNVSSVVIATSTNREDDQLEEWCLKNRVPICRGSLEDVLDRYYQCALRHHAENVIRVTSDCPFIDPGIIDGTIGLLEQGYDYCSNTREPRTYPRGLDVEAMSMKTLERAWREDHDPRWREHVTPYIYRHPELFKIGGIANDEDLSDIRVTVDTFEDLQFVNLIAQEIGDHTFTWKTMVSTVRRHPEWMILNSQISQKVVPER